MEIFELLVSVLTLSLVLFNQVMLAGGLAVTLHSIVTVSSSLGVLLFPLIDKLLRRTVQISKNTCACMCIGINSRTMHMHCVV